MFCSARVISIITQASAVNWYYVALRYVSSLFLRPKTLPKVCSAMLIVNPSASCTNPHLKPSVEAMVQETNATEYEDACITAPNVTFPCLLFACMLGSCIRIRSTLPNQSSTPCHCCPIPLPVLATDSCYRLFVACRPRTICPCNRG